MKLQSEYKSFYELKVGDSIYLHSKAYPIKVIPFKILNIKEYPKEAPSKDRTLEIEIDSKFEKITLKIPVQHSRKYCWFYSNCYSELEKDYCSDLQWIIDYKTDILNSSINNSNKKIKDAKRLIKREEEKIKKYLQEIDNPTKYIIDNEEA